MEHVKATYDGGVLTLRIPVAEKAKPRKIEIETKEPQHQHCVIARQLAMRSHSDDSRLGRGSSLRPRESLPKQPARGH